MLRVKLFGTPQILLNDRPLATPLIGKGMALFAYLITQAEPSPRTILADLLWTDLAEPSARMNLRGTLYNLRQIVGDYFSVTR